jgi:hypothetical protein
MEKRTYYSYTYRGNPITGAYTKEQLIAIFESFYMISWFKKDYYKPEDFKIFKIEATEVKLVAVNSYTIEE